MLIVSDNDLPVCAKNQQNLNKNYKNHWNLMLQYSRVIRVAEPCSSCDVTKNRKKLGSSGKSLEQCSMTVIADPDGLGGRGERHCVVAARVAKDLATVPTVMLKTMMTF